MSSYEGKASLYIELGEGQTNTLFKIAALRGVSGFEDGMGFSTLVADVENPNSWTSSVSHGSRQPLPLCHWVAQSNVRCIGSCVAHLMTATIYSEDDPYTPVGQRDEVALDVEAVHAETGGRRIFTASDYPAFIITDTAAVAFFKYFTKQ